MLHFRFRPWHEAFRFTAVNRFSKLNMSAVNPHGNLLDRHQNSLYTLYNIQEIFIRLGCGRPLAFASILLPAAVVWVLRCGKPAGSCASRLRRLGQGATAWPSRPALPPGMAGPPRPSGPVAVNRRGIPEATPEALAAAVFRAQQVEKAGLDAMRESVECLLLLHGFVFGRHRGYRAEVRGIPHWQRRSSSGCHQCRGRRFHADRPEHEVLRIQHGQHLWHGGRDCQGQTYSSAKDLGVPSVARMMRRPIRNIPTSFHWQPNPALLETESTHN
eukprot:s3855_g4.t1